MANVQALILLVVFILILTSLAPTIITNTDTSAGTSLENASSSSKAMFGLIEIMYVLLGIFGILAVIGIGKGRK